MLDLEAVIDELVAIGPRYTASPAHRRFESLLADGFRAAGAEVFTDDYLVPSWDPDDVQLEIEASEGRYRPVTVASVYPHSGTTDPAGVIGRLIDLGALSSVDLRNADLRGCVALITYPPLREPLPYPSIWGLAHGDDEPAPREWGMGSQHWLAIEKLRQQLLGMGAVGLIVGWQELGPGPAAGQYQPILPPSVRKLYGEANPELAALRDESHGGVPAVWVDRAVRAQLSTAARAAQRVRLVLTTAPEVPRPTSTIVAELPGSTDDAIVLVTHTDGVNVIQENGPLALVALASRLARERPAVRRHCMIFIAATAHFCRTVLDRDGVMSIAESEGVLTRHPEIGRRAVAAVGIEHLGSLEVEDGGDDWALTGRPEWTHCVTEHAGLAAQALQAIRSSGSGPTIVASGRVWGLAFPFQGVGVPTLSYGCAPGYLMSEASDGHRRFWSRERMERELDALTTLIASIDRSPPARLPRP